MTFAAGVTDRGLLDTSVFVAKERGRALGALPNTSAISVVTIAELHLGVLMTEHPRVRAQRLRTLAAVEALFEPLPIDRAVARVFNVPRQPPIHAGTRTSPITTSVSWGMGMPRLRSKST